jgi:hypothetical protein
LTFTLCATCNKSIFSWETPSMLPGLPPDVEWTHFIRDEEHFAVPCKSIRDRILYCAVCRRRQAFGPAGWYCPNIHCATKVDKD